MSWGRKKYTPVDINKENDNIVIYSPVKQAPKASFSKGKDVRVVKKINSVTDKLKRQNRRVLKITDYMKYLHSEYQSNILGMDVHHWVPRSRIGQNDYFVCCLNHEKHMVVHSLSTPSAFIEEVGEDNLLIDSALMFASWLNTDSAKKNRFFVEYYGMLKVIQQDPTNFENVLQATRDCADEIRFKVK